MRRPQFDTTRSELGELVYQLKYKGQADAADKIAQIMAVTYSANAPVSSIHLVTAVPASTTRTVQPVAPTASKVASLLEKPFSGTAIQKIKATPTLKSIAELEQRRAVLDGAFTADPSQVGKRGVLLVDDLYRSGSTANAVTLALIAAGADPVHFLAATRTRSNV